MNCMKRQTALRFSAYSSSALTLLVGQLEMHPTVKILLQQFLNILPWGPSLT